MMVKRSLVAVLLLSSTQAVAQTPSPLRTSIDVSATTAIKSTTPFGALFHVTVGAGTNQGLMPGDELVVTALGAPVILEVLNATATTAKTVTESVRGGQLTSNHTASFRARQCVPVAGATPAQVKSPSQTPAGWLELPIDSFSGNSMSTASIDPSIVAGAPAVAFAAGNNNARVTGTVDRIDGFGATIALASTPPAGVKWLKLFVRRASCTFAGTPTAIPLPLASLSISSIQPVGSTSSIIVFGPAPNVRLGDTVQVRSASATFPFVVDSVGRNDSTGTLAQKPSALGAQKIVQADLWACGAPIVLTSAQQQQPPNGFEDFVPGGIGPAANAQAMIDATGATSVIRPGNSALVYEIAPGKPPVYGVVERVRNGRIEVLVPGSASSRLKNNMRTIRVARSQLCQRP